MDKSVRKWHVDASFSVHKDTRSHTGGFMNMGIGRYYFQFSKKKWNTKISTGYEIVRVKDVLTQVIWTQYFLKEQEYKIRENIFYQNNQSIIKLENNGRLSSRKRPCHINIRYYLITDMIKSQEEYVEFCLTLDMIRDYFKNALQGYWFFLYHNITLGIVEDETLSYNESVRVLI